MFDLVTGKLDRPLHDRRRGPAVVSVAMHGAAIALLGAALIFTAAKLPDVKDPTMMAFVAPEQALPPHSLPPPMPQPAPEPKKRSRPPAAPAPVSPPAPVVHEMPPVTEAAPVGSPTAIPSETTTPGVATGGIAGAADAMASEDGFSGAVLGGAEGTAPAPVPAPVPPAPPKPVRVGGLIAAPKLLYQVPPVYPPLAAAAQVSGVVIVEATVGADGLVESVRVLQGHPMLESAAVDSVRQWRYSPVLIEGKPTPFILSVTVTFRTKRPN